VSEEVGRPALDYQSELIEALRFVRAIFDDYLEPEISEFKMSGVTVVTLAHLVIATLKANAINAVAQTGRVATEDEIEAHIGSRIDAQIAHLMAGGEGLDVLAEP
jgi:hypothetical protein